MNTIPSITLRTLDRELASATHHYEAGDYTASLAAVRSLLCNAEALEMFLELMIAPQNTRANAKRLLSVKDCLEIIQANYAAPKTESGAPYQRPSTPSSELHHQD
jgi:hypothetical protein